MSETDLKQRSNTSKNEVVLQCTNLKKHYPITAGPLKRKVSEVKAVDGVDLRVRRGEIRGVVGESGCGKSTLARMFVKLHEPTEGYVYFDVPEDIADEIEELETRDGRTLSSEERDRLAELRKQYAINELTGDQADHYRKNVQFVFQNPSNSLNPRAFVRRTVEEPLEVHTDLSPDEREDRVTELLEEVGLGEEYLYRYPHMLSGGQKQRVAIARAIATNPDFVVLDEPTSALDVSVQAQILNLLDDLQDKLDLTYLFITHDLGVVRHIATDVAVMYLGKVVENTSRKDLFADPKHPYTEALLSSSPAIDTDSRIRLTGDVPDAEDPPTGCYFHTRCHKAESYCGWSGRDLESLIQQHAPEDETVRSLYEHLEETTYSGYEAEFTFDAAIDIEDVRRALSGDDDTLRTYNEVLFEAIEETAVGGNAVTIRFREIETPELLEDAPDHEVACHLYSGAYE